jgi:hypothetical protein
VSHVVEPQLLLTVAKPDLSTSEEPREDLKSRTDNLIGLLEFEISRIHAASSRPGWTRWAILVAMSSAVWLGLGELGSKSFSLQSVLFTALVIHTAYDLLVCFSHLIAAAGRNDRTNERRYRSTTLLMNGRASLTANVARYGVLFAVAWTSPYLADGYDSIIIQSARFAIFFVWVPLLVVSSIDVPVAMNASVPSVPHRVVAAMLVLSTGAALISVGAGAYPEVWNDIATLRLGGLIVVVLVLACVLAAEATEPPLLETLVDVRRRLGLGELDFQTARGQVDIALRGMTVSSMFQEQAERILQRLREGARSADSGQNQVNTLKCSIETDRLDLRNSDILIVNAAIDSAIASLDKAVTEVEEAGREHERLVKSLVRFHRIVPADPALYQFVQRLGDQIREESGAMKNLGDSIRADLQSIKSLVTSLIGGGGEPMGKHEKPSSEESPSLRLPV